jgi:hypothetical protein
MTKKTSKNKETGRTVDIQREEFGTETGDFNSYKTMELIEEAKRKNKK